jgi:hypothetical protein
MAEGITIEEGYPASGSDDFTNNLDYKVVSGRFDNQENGLKTISN